MSLLTNHFKFSALKLRSLFILFAFLLGGFQSSYCQSKQADDYLKNGNYLGALTILLKAYKLHPEDMEMAHDIAICYLNTNINKKAALIYIEKVYEISGEKVEDDVVYEYALALTYHLEYRDAKKIFLKYQSLAPKGKYGDVVARNIINCDEAIKLMGKPLNISYKNLGEKVNSEYPDYYPFVSKNDSILYFTSRRRGNLGGSKEFDGYYPADIYYHLLNKSLSKAKNVGKQLNSIGDDQVV